LEATSQRALAAVVDQRNLLIGAMEQAVADADGVRRQEDQGIRRDRAEPQVGNHPRKEAGNKVHQDQHATDLSLLLRDRGNNSGSTLAQTEARPPKEITVQEHPQNKRATQEAGHQDADEVEVEDADTEAVEDAIRVKVETGVKVAIVVEDEDEVPLDAHPGRGRGAPGARRRSTDKRESSTAAATTEAAGSSTADEEEAEVPEGVHGRVGVTINKG
jgi:hypothetical protein